MITQEQVVEVHRKNPTWSASQIATHLNCRTCQVGVVAFRKRLSLPKKRRARSSFGTIIELGRACKKANVSLNDIEKLTTHRKTREVEHA